MFFFCGSSKGLGKCFVREINFFGHSGCFSSLADEIVLFLWLSKFLAIMGSCVLFGQALAFSVHPM